MERIMNQFRKRTALTLAAFGLIAGLGSLVSATPSQAVVYCKTVGVPRGCIVRPVVPRVVYCTRVGYPHGCVVRPVVAPHVVYCTRVGYPRGCIVR
jgi:hypothetical protein